MTCSEEVLLPPSLVTQEEDEDAERKKEDGFGDSEGSSNKNGSCVVEAVVGLMLK